MRNKFNIAVAIIAVVALLLAGSFMSDSHVNGAIITPVSNNNANGGVRFAVFNAGTPVAADTRTCIDLSAYDVGDFQVIIAQTVASGNTTTVTTQYSNVQGDANPTQYYIAGASLLSGTPGPANTPNAAMSQQALFGRYSCVLVDVANATPVSVYVSAVAK